MPPADYALEGDKTAPKMNATKAHYAGGVSGAITAVLMLGAHFAGLITLGPDAIMAALVSIGGGLSVGVVSWLGTYRAPANQPK